MEEATTLAGTQGNMPGTKNKVVMDVRNITKSLPLGREKIEILKGISFQIMSGEFVSIVGPSGSGKSTVLGIIAGLDNPTSGQVLIDGVDITRMTEGKLAVVRNSKIGMVFQAFNLIPTLTAQENVEIPLYVGKHKGSPSARAQELLALVGLSHRLDHRPNQLSGGEQQRVAIARALATDPAFVIADEPTGNLDARNGENVLKLIAELREQTGKTFIIASHDPYFTSLKNNGTITNYTAVTTTNGSLSASGSTFQAFSVDAVDPNNYPIVSQPAFVTPGNGSVSRLLTNNQAIVTQNFLDTYHKKLGDSFDVYIKKAAGSGETLHVKIAGVVASTGVFAQSGSLVLVSSHDYQAAAPNTPVSYSVVDVTTANQAHTDAAVKAINQQFPLASTQTVADALKAQQSSIDNISKFLEIACLLALLIGGVGIVNTIQVLLSRRKTEIAMLKTAGYRRMDLYALFGLEAGLLGLVGGVIGAAAATGLSYIVRILVQNTGLNVPFILNPWTIAGGVAIGFAIALIFGLMPIVQAANIRPLNVIRELADSKGVSRLALTIGLLLILSVLFCVLAIVILNNDVVLGIEAVYGTFAFLLLLSVFFGLVVLIVSKLPVPEHFNLKQLALVLAGLVVSALVYLVLPVFGIILGAISLAGIVVVLLPRSWKVNTKMALRNIGRQRARTTTTVLALFIGVFTVGLVLALWEELQGGINNSFAQNLTYNVVTMTSGTDTTTLQAKLGTVPGLSKTSTDTYTQTLPTSINGQPLQ